MMMKTILTALSLFGACAAACAQTSSPTGAPLGVNATLPPALRNLSPAPAAGGDALRAQVHAKLKAQFEQADLDASGSLTAVEAKQAGLGYVVKHFDEIDTARRGAVTFEDVRAYLARARQAADRR